MITFYHVGMCQEVPCRNWYTKTDRNGNTINLGCQEAWNKNSNGQKHGKYILYFENENPNVVSTYVNGILNGKYTQYDVDGTTIVLQGNYFNDKRNGNWKIGSSNGSFKDGNRIGIWKFTLPNSGNLTQDFDQKTYRYSQFSREFQGSVENGKLNGECLMRIEVDKMDLTSFNGIVKYVANVTMNGFDQSGIDNNGKYTGRVNFDRDMNAEEDLVVVEGFSSMIKVDFLLNERSAFTYPMKIDKSVFKGIVTFLKQKHNLTSANVSLKFKNGTLDQEYLSLIFDTNGTKIDETTLVKEAMGIVAAKELLLAEAKQIEDAKKEKELKEKPDRDAYNQAVKYGSIEAYLYYIENFPNGIYSSEIRQVIKYGKFLFFQNSEGITTRELLERYINGSKNKVQFIQPKNSTFKIDLTQPKSLWVRDTVYQVVLEKSSKEKYLFDLILYYNEALTDECPSSILENYEWASTIQTAIEATIKKDYGQSNIILKAASKNYLTDFLTGINLILLGDKKASKEFIKSIRQEAALPNNQYLPSVYQQVGYFIDMLVSNGIPKETFQKLATFENDTAIVSERQIASFTK